jgi:hypothetical protein
MILILVFFCQFVISQERGGLWISPGSFSDYIFLGKYDFVLEDINEKNFPDKVEKGYGVEYQVFDFGESVLLDFVLTEMKKKGFRPATLIELLHFAEVQPKIWGKTQIIAFGSVWRDSIGRRKVPCLQLGMDRRDLYLEWSDSFHYHIASRFLGIRIEE